MARKKVGIKEVAEAAGVSITTVSHALSGKGRLPADTRERVRLVAERLGYAPNAAARSLAGATTGVLATYVSLPGNSPLAFTEIDYYVGVINAATAECIERGYSLVIAPSTAGPETWARLPIDGVIVIDPAVGDSSLADLRTRGFPLVLVGRDLHGEADDLIVQNDRSAATRAVLDHLADGGDRRVDILTLSTYESFSDEAVEEYRRWCRTREREPGVFLVGANSTAGPMVFRNEAARFLDRSTFPIAVFCLYERLAIELLAVARERGVRIPEDLALCCVSELGLAADSTPPLTTLEINQSELGARAARLLIDRVEGRPTRSVLDVPVQLVARASTRR
jgi:DNA-binding LacI/PurR family transcriptional regulator